MSDLLDRLWPDGEAGGARLATAFTALLQAAPVSVAVFDLQGQYLWVNAAWAQTHGVPAGDHPGRTPEELTPDGAPRMQCALERVVATGAPLTGADMRALTVPQPEPTSSRVEYWHPVRDNGQVVAVATILTESGAPWALELATLLADAERLHLVLAAGDMGTWDWDLHTGRISWDERTAAIFGVALEDFDGTLEMFRERLLVPEDAESVTAALEHAIATRGAFSRDYRVTRPDGTVAWVSARGRVLCDERGQPQTMAGVVQDRTDAHSLEERLARTLEHIDEAFYSLDSEWRFTYLNVRAEQVLQRSRDELIGQVLWEEFPEAAGGRLDEAFRRAVATGHPVTLEEFYPPLGLWAEVRAYPEPAGLSVYFHDITERKAKEAGRQAQLAAQERAHRAAADVLDLAARLNPHSRPQHVAAAACAAGTEIFGCARVSVWRLRETGEATLVGQHGGEPALRTGVTLPAARVAGLSEVLHVPRTAFVPDARALPAEAARDLARRLGVRSLIAAPVPLGPRGQSQVTVLSWGRVVGEPEPEMVDVVDQFAQQIALSIAQAHRWDAETQVNDLNAELQANLLPTPAVRQTAVDIAALYRPGERRLKLGGDFYDIIQAPDGRLALVLGDVTGHGADAAALGATLRAAWRALTLDDAEPAAAVRVLDALLRSERDSEEQLVTVCCARLDLQRRTLEVVRAGHPPPVIATSEHTGLVAAPAGLLLGAPLQAPTWDSAMVDLPQEWALLFYTDGLTEARAAPNSTDRVGEARLADYFACQQPLAANDAQAVPRRLHDTIRTAADEPFADDVAVLFLRHPRR